MHGDRVVARELLAKQGLLSDLTPLVKEHGWDTAISERASVTARYDAKGEMGGDKPSTITLEIASLGETVVVSAAKVDGIKISLLS